jgi:flagellar hook-associated protein 2
MSTIGSLTSSSSTAGLLGSTPPIQITGLASGLNTNQIISELMTIAQKPVNDLINRRTGISAENTQLSSLQTSLQNLVLNAQSLSDPVLFHTSQTVASSNPSLVSATTASGAGIGGYQVQVSQLANSAQRTFTFTAPSSNEAITIDGESETITAGQSIQDFVNMINSDPNADVYAASTDASTVVLSSRATGDTGTNFIGVIDPGTALVEKPNTAKQGKDAQFTVDGVSGTSHTNTVSNAIPGVSLALSGLAAGTSPVTVTVAAPAPDPKSIQSAITTFVNSYNSIIDQITAQTSQLPSTSDPTVGRLYGDVEFTSLLSNMRRAMYASGAGLPAGQASLADIGVTTGAAVGNGTTSQSSLAGKLTVDTSKLAQAIATNPGSVQQILRTFATSFANLVNTDAGPGGVIDSRVQGNNSEISNLNGQITDQNAMLQVKQNEMVQQFAALEAAMSQAQSQGNWLAGQVAALTANSSASKG